MMRGAIISTDQGPIPIECIAPSSTTIDGAPILRIHGAPQLPIHPPLMIVPKNTLGENVPSADIVIRSDRLIYTAHIGLCLAADLVDIIPNVRLLTYTESRQHPVMYNIIMQNHNIIRANKLQIETTLLPVADEFRARLLTQMGK